MKHHSKYKYHSYKSPLHQFQTEFRFLIILLFSILSNHVLDFFHLKNYQEEHAPDRSIYENIHNVNNCSEMAEISFTKKLFEGIIENEDGFDTHAQQERK